MLDVEDKLCNCVICVLTVVFHCMHAHTTAKHEKKEKKSKQQRGGGGGGGRKTEPVKKLEVNEEKLDLLLDMLKEADVTTEENQAETQTLLELEGVWGGRERELRGGHVGEM